MGIEDLTVTTTEEFVDQIRYLFNNHRKGKKFDLSEISCGIVYGAGASSEEDANFFAALGRLKNEGYLQSRPSPVLKHIDTSKLSEEDRLFIGTEYFRPSILYRISNRVKSVLTGYSS